MPKAVGASKVTSKFQVTVPEAVRLKLNVKVGDTLVFVEEDGKIVVTTEVAT
jgi:AbrB family looped-hinge helix DNA binding protein